MVTRLSCSPSHFLSRIKFLPFFSDHSLHPQHSSSWLNFLLLQHPPPFLSQDKFLNTNILNTQKTNSLKYPSHPQVKALVELVTSLMCTSRPSGGRQAPTPLPSNFHEMMRNMVDAGVRRALLQVLRGLDLNHPKVCSSFLCLYLYSLVAAMSCGNLRKVRAGLLA